MMKITFKKIILLVAILTVALMCFAFGASAETESYYTYEVKNGKATITDVDSSISGDVTIPDTLGGYPVVNIDEYAFSYCKDLLSIKIPDGVKRIEKNTFYDCEYLRGITIPDSVTYINSEAFWWKSDTGYGYVVLELCIYCNKDSYASDYAKKKNIACVYLDASSKENRPSGKIGKFTWKLDKITGVLVLSGNGDMPDLSSETSSWLKFNHCITSVKIPEGITKIGERAFYHCYRIRSITIPDKVTKIGAYAFVDCESLVNLKLGKRIKNICSYAFRGCDGITNISLPNSVRTIEDFAFFNCGEITKLKMGKNIRHIGSGVFANNECQSPLYAPPKIRKLYFPDIDMLFNIEFKYDEIIDEEYDYSDYNFGIFSGVEEVYFENKYTTKLVIPDDITVISDNLFKDCNCLTSVIIPNGVKTIGKESFSNCDQFTDIVIPDSVLTLGESAFESCDKLKTVKIGKNVKNIGKAFGFCTNLQSITVDKNNLYFSNDKYGVLFNKNKTELLQYPTGNERSEYTIPDSVKIIKDWAFSYCTHLNKVIIGNNVTSIGEYAFSYCEYLNNVTIPDSVTSVGECVFLFDNLTDVYYRGTKEQWKKININVYGAKIYYHNHKFSKTTTIATLTKNGKVVKKCSICGKIQSTTIYYPKTIKLSATKYTYDEKVKSPTVTVKDSKGNTLKKDSDYTLKYESGRKLSGKYTVTVTFKGKYSGTKKLYFTIAPKTTSKVAATQTTTSITLKWSKVTGATGYRVFRKVDGKWKTLTNTTKLTYTIKKLKAGTKYTFAVRPYTVDGEDTILATSYTQLKTATKCKTPTLKVTSTMKGVVALSWTNVTGETGYELYGSSNKSSGFEKLTTTKADAVKASKNKLTSKKTYYFKVRAYTKTNSGTVYSAWSSVKSVKIK